MISKEGHDLPDEIIEAIITGNMKQNEVRKQFGLPERAARVAVIRADERERTREKVGQRSAPASTKNRKGFTGKSADKRVRELRARQRGDYSERVRAQLEFAKMCVVLEDIHIEDYGLEDTDTWLAADVYDDLVSLAEHVDQQLSAVQRYISEHDVLARIMKLRDTAGRSPEEAKTALRLASRLEQKMTQRLGS